jgi:periplasmic divalent cation tolerance protein
MIIDKVHPDKIVFVYTTCTNKDEARSIGLACINEHLAVCADFWPIESVYPWDGVIENVEQYTLMLTTKSSLSEKLTLFIAGLHSYSTPMIATSEVANMSPSYKFWMDKVLLEKGEYPEFKNKEVDQDYEPGKLK